MAGLGLWHRRLGIFWGKALERPLFQGEGGGECWECAMRGPCCAPNVRRGVEYPLLGVSSGVQPVPRQVGALLAAGPAERD